MDQGSDDPEVQAKRRNKDGLGTCSGPPLFFKQCPCDPNTDLQVRFQPKSGYTLVWVHPSHCFFSEKMFSDDLRNNRTRHCSSLLVNAILAAACHYSDRPEARSDPLDHSTAGDHFFEEAVQLLKLRPPSQ